MILRFPVSGWDVTLGCPGAAQALKVWAPPRETTNPQLDGTAAHLILERSIQSLNEGKEPDLKRMIGASLEVKHNREKHKVLITRDIIRAAEIALEDIRRVMDEHPGGELKAEAKYDAGFYIADTAPTICIVDAVYICGSKAWVWEFKYGRTNVPISTYQLIGCAMGLKGWAGTEGPEIVGIEAAIVQPRAPHKDQWFKRVTFTEPDFVEFGEAATNVIRVAKQDNPPRTPGAHCFKCDAKARCPEGTKWLFQEQGKVASTEAVPTTTELVTHFSAPMEMVSDEQMVRIVENKDLIAGFIKACEKHLLAKEKESPGSTGMKIVEQDAHRRYVDNIEAYIPWLVQKVGLDIDQVAPRKITGVPTLLNEVAKVNPKYIVAVKKLIENPHGKHVLAPASDPRPDVRPTPEDMFGPPRS